MYKLNFQVMILICVFVPLIMASQKNNRWIKVYYKQLSDCKYDFYATNENFCPYRVEVDLKNADNLFVTAHLPFYTVIEPQTEEYLFTVVTWKEPEKVLKVIYNTYIGDIHVLPDTNYVYFLPYEPGTMCRVNQGYNERFTHKGAMKYSIDFGMSIGSYIYAAREGIVVDVKDDSNKYGLSKYYRKFANYVTIYHSDGTFSQYVHIMKNGSFVKIGDYVEKGQLIGLSGNTGRTRGPHLHFMVYKATYKAKETIPTLFLTFDGVATYLQRKNYYTSIRMDTTQAVVQVKTNVPDSSINSNYGKTLETDLGGL